MKPPRKIHHDKRMALSSDAKSHTFLKNTTTDNHHEILEVYKLFHHNMTKVIYFSLPPDTGAPGYPGDQTSFSRHIIPIKY
jgi:hypothetical protein